MLTQRQAELARHMRDFDYKLTLEKKKLAWKLNYIWCVFKYRLLWVK